MNVHISYKLHKTPDIEKEIQHQVDKIRKRLQVFRPELVHLKGLVEQNTSREGTTVSLNLRLPSGQMAVQSAASTPASAVKSAFDDLMQQLARHKAQLRSTHKWPRWRRVANARPEPQIPFEKTLAAVQLPVVSSDDIRTYVNANLARLERFVERELYFRETSDQVEINAISKEEIIDEAIATALGDGGDKPERLALEPWLYRLAMRALDEFVYQEREENGKVHLEESARKRNVKASDEAELQFHQPDEMFSEESIIADKRVSTPEQIASSDEMLRLVENALRGADRKIREAFILSAVEGFTDDEIAVITDRKADEVRSSIAAARDHLKRSPLFATTPKQAVMPRTSTA